VLLDFLELDLAPELDFDREVVDFRAVDFFALEDFPAVERERELFVLRFVLELLVLVAEPAADHNFSRSFNTVRFALPASRRSCLSARSTSRYVLFALRPKFEPIDCSAVLASSSAFSNRLVVASTSRRVIGPEPDVRAVLRRVVVFFAGGMIENSPKVGERGGCKAYSY
jgi:hypothetical protein